jgi:hypothetical protein
MSARCSNPCPLRAIADMHRASCCRPEANPVGLLRDHAGVCLSSRGSIISLVMCVTATCGGAFSSKATGMTAAVSLQSRLLRHARTGDGGFQGAASPAAGQDHLGLINFRLFT